MGHVSVVTDSTAGLPADLAARRGLHVIPQWVHFGEQSCRDGVDLTPEQFYPLLARAPDLPTTSQPLAGEFLELYRELAGRVEAIVSVHASTELSGTVASALAGIMLVSAGAGALAGAGFTVVLALILVPRSAEEAWASPREGGRRFSAWLSRTFAARAHQEEGT